MHLEASQCRLVAVLTTARRLKGPPNIAIYWIISLSTGDVEPLIFILVAQSVLQNRNADKRHPVGQSGCFTPGHMYRVASHKQAIQALFLQGHKECY